MKNYKIILSNEAVNVIEVNGTQYQLSASIDIDKFVNEIINNKDIKNIDVSSEQSNKNYTDKEIPVPYKSKQKYYKG